MEVKAIRTCYDGMRRQKEGATFPIKSAEAFSPSSMEILGQVPKEWKETIDLKIASHKNRAKTAAVKPAAVGPIPDGIVKAITDATREALALLREEHRRLQAAAGTPAHQKGGG